MGNRWRGRGSEARATGRSAEDRGAEFARVAVRDAEVDLRLVDDGEGDGVEGKQSATASSLLMTRSCSTTRRRKGVPGCGEGELADIEAGEVSCSGKVAGVVGGVGEGAGKVQDDALHLRRDDGAQRRQVRVDRAELPDAVEARRMSGATRKNVRRRRLIADESKNVQIEAIAW